MKYIEIRDPIHGFIKLNEWERDIIDQPAFQRLRRIKQLAWTNMVYPGTNHSRFEHSLGVMHVASRVFDTLVEKCKDILFAEFGYNDSGLESLRQMIRLAALSHDIGHGPFSHGAEEVLPKNKETGLPYTHEDYSAAIVLHELGDIIENHPINQRNYRIRASQITEFFSPGPHSENSIWHELISSQMDADRMDYLLRDSYYAGVNYGKFDLDRIIATLTLCEDPEGGFRIGVDSDGAHAVEGLILARYMMFTQVYFHKTRNIYDYHLVEALKSILEDGGGTLPPPDSADSIREYLSWDDWHVLGLIADGRAGEHGAILKDRKHYRMIHETSEVPTFEEQEGFEKLLDVWNNLSVVTRDAGNSWYKFEKEEILINPLSYERGKGATPLSICSPVVRGLQTIKQKRIYVPAGQREEAEEIRYSIKGGNDV